MVSSEARERYVRETKATVPSTRIRWRFRSHCDSCPHPAYSRWSDPTEGDGGGRLRDGLPSTPSLHPTNPKNWIIRTERFVPSGGRELTMKPVQKDPYWCSHNRTLWSTLDAGRHNPPVVDRTSGSREGGRCRTPSSEMHSRRFASDRALVSARGLRRPRRGSVLSQDYPCQTEVSSLPTRRESPPQPTSSIPRTKDRAFRQTTASLSSPLTPRPVAGNNAPKEPSVTRTLEARGAGDHHRGSGRGNVTRVR